MGNEGFATMDVGVCRQCPKWTEFVSLIGRGIVVLTCGCLKFGIMCDKVLGDGRRSRDVGETLRRHGGKWSATHSGKAFWEIVGKSLGEEHGRIMGKLSRTTVPDRCPYYMEHMMAKWNGSMRRGGKWQKERRREIRVGKSIPGGMSEDRC